MKWLVNCTDMESISYSAKIINKKIIKSLNCIVQEFGFCSYFYLVESQELHRTLPSITLAPQIKMQNIIETI